MVKKVLIRHVDNEAQKLMNFNKNVKIIHLQLLLLKDGLPTMPNSVPKQLSFSTKKLNVATNKMLTDITRGVNRDD